jgi:hypothetical protein
LYICVEEASECCKAAADARYHDARHDKALPVADMSIENVDGRHMIMVGYTFRVFLAVVERDSERQNVEVLSLLPCTFVSPVSGDTSSCFNYFFSESVSPSSVEKYILNETYLI